MTSFRVGRPLVPPINVFTEQPERQQRLIDLLLEA